MLSSRLERFKHVIAQTSDTPQGLDIAAAKGIYLYGHSGESWMDLISGIGPSILGHQNKNVIEAICQQANQYLHSSVYGEHIQTPQLALAELLCSVLPESLNQVYYVSTGTEAVELALKVAKRSTSRYQILAAKQAYHGSTQGAASLMHDEFYTQAYRPLVPGIIHSTFQSDEFIESITSELAAVIIEPIQAEAGILVPENAWLQKVRRRCDAHGVLCIFDEIQSAYGRTGTRFAFEHSGVVPDLLLLGKAFGGGMPLGACVGNRALLACLSENPPLGHITTMGGNPVCCASGLAVLQQLLEGAYIQEVPAKEKMIQEYFKQIPQGKLRTAGLWAALELPSAHHVMQVCQYALRNGIIVDWFLFNDCSIRIAPPLTITIEELSHACTVLRNGIQEVCNK